MYFTSQALQRVKIQARQEFNLAWACPVPEVGFEPTRPKARDFESRVSAVPPLRPIHLKVYGSQPSPSKGRIHWVAGQFMGNQESQNACQR